MVRGFREENCVNGSGTCLGLKSAEPPSIVFHLLTASTLLMAYPARRHQRTIHTIDHGSAVSST